MADTILPPNSTAKPEDVRADNARSNSSGEYRVMEVREDGTAILGLTDESGGMFPASNPDKLDINKRSTVFIKSDSVDKDGVPVNASVSRVKSS